jgi:hypothetical protein
MEILHPDVKHTLNKTVFMHEGFITGLSLYSVLALNYKPVLVVNYMRISDEEKNYCESLKMVAILIVAQRVRLLIRFEVFTAVTRKNAVFWDVAAATCSRWYLTGFLYPEDGGDTFLRNIGLHNIYTTPHPRRWYSCISRIYREDVSFFVANES